MLPSTKEKCKLRRCAFQLSVVLSVVAVESYAIAMASVSPRGDVGEFLSESSIGRTRATLILNNAPLGTGHSGQETAGGAGNALPSGSKIEIQHLQEYNAYEQAIAVRDPKDKASALEAFAYTYPRSAVIRMVLEQLMDIYQSLNDEVNVLGAAGRLLQIDPSNVRATYISVWFKRAKCLKTRDTQTCDDAAALAQKGLALTKPVQMMEADFKKVTEATYPTYHSAIALDEVLSKKNDKAAIAEYKTELMLYTQDQTKTGIGLEDTLQLAETYARADARDMVLACWFYARVLNFASPAEKVQVEPKLEYWYKRFHGSLDGINDVKVASAGTLFPPDGWTITPAPTSQE